MPAPDERQALADRRARVMAAMGDGVMLLAAAPEQLRSGDVYYPYRQDSDFDYLTGLGEPECVAVLAPGHKDPFALFVRPHDPERAIWVGARVGLDGAVDGHGAIVAHPIDDLEKELPRWLRTSDRVFVDLSRQDALLQRLHAIVRRVQAERPRLGSGPTALLDASAVIHEQRLLKAPDELARMRDAIAIACEAHHEAMRTVRPGMHEYEVEALIDFTFRRRGATGPAYPSIIAGGANGTVLHYTANDQPLAERDLLLIDAGAERAGYCADVTRTWPVGAKLLAGAARLLPGGARRAARRDRRGQAGRDARRAPHDRGPRARRGARHDRARRGQRRRDRREGDVPALLHAPDEPLARPRRARRRPLQARRHAASARARHGVHGRARPVHPRPTRTTCPPSSAASASASRTTST
jgi:Xaa-Pro aminopeptidase